MDMIMAEEITENDPEIMGSIDATMNWSSVIEVAIF